jgi:hypothetical protein
MPFGHPDALCRGLEIVLADGPGVRQACEAPLFAPPPGPAAWAPFSIEVVGMAREGKAGDVLRGQSQFGYGRRHSPEDDFEAPQPRGSE